MVALHSGENTGLAVELKPGVAIATWLIGVG
jgi:hypothetical protein